jgi:hypothetical protein
LYVEQVIIDLKKIKPIKDIQGIYGLYDVYQNSIDYPL